MKLKKGSSFVFGVHPVRIAIKKKHDRLSGVWFVSGESLNQKLTALRQQALEKKVPIFEISLKEIESCVGLARHQGIIAQYKPEDDVKKPDLEAFLSSLNTVPLFLILDGLQDPHNLGACLRTADAAGVTAVILTKDRSVGITSVVRKVAAGAADTLPIFTVTNLARSIELLKKYDIWVVGTDLSAKKSVFEKDLCGSLALVIGAEGKGIRSLTKKLCDDVISIPMFGSIESLNVSVASGILLYEARRQQADG